jgi:outer membrane protein OmpA-like peptidoglycan-associated protein
MIPKRFFGSNLVSTVALLMVPLSACSNLWRTGTAQVDSSRNSVMLTQPEETVRLEGVQFKAGGATPRRNSKAILDAAAEILASGSDNMVYADAYCGRHDGKKANPQLAQQRAENVKAYLVTQGIPSERMVARGFGVANSAAGSDSRIYKQKSGVELIPFKNEPSRQISLIHS